MMSGQSHVDAFSERATLADDNAEWVVIESEFEHVDGASQTEVIYCFTLEQLVFALQRGVDIASVKCLVHEEFNAAKFAPDLVSMIRLYI